MSSFPCEKMIPTDEKSLLRRPLFHQIHASVSVALIFSCAISTLAYPAVALPQMILPDSMVHFTPEQASWFVSIQLLPSIPGAILGGMLSEYFGPRRLTLMVSPVLWVSYSMMMVASWESVVRAGLAETMLLLCRFAQGMGLAVLNPVVYIYTFEMCDDKRRGTMTGFLNLWATFGYLLCYIFGCFFTWETIAWLVPTVTIVPGFIGTFLAPESPHWQMRKDKEQEALETLNEIRVSTEEIEEEVSTVKKTSESEISLWESLQELKKKHNLLAVFAAALVIIMKEISGNSGITAYIVHIFQYAGVGFQAIYSSVVIGSVRLIFNCLSGFLIYNVPHKPMMYVSTSLVAAAGTSLGIFFLLQSRGYDVSSLGWLPLASLVIFMLGYDTAEGPLCWVTSVEVLPGPVRHIGCGIINAVFSIMAFIVSKTFTDMQSVFGLHGVFWSYAGSSILTLIMYALFVPETYGMSLKDIEGYWKDVCGGKKPLINHNKDIEDKGEKE